MLGEQVGGLLVAQGAGDNVALRQAAPAQRFLELRDAVAGEQRSVELLADEHVTQLADELTKIVAVQDLPPGHSGSPKSLGRAVFGTTMTWSQRSRPWVQRGSDSMKSRSAMARLHARLTDGFDVVDALAAGLAPALPVVPDLAALDLEADDARALDGDEEVDLVVFQVIGHALARDDEVTGLQLFDQGAPNGPLGAVGQPRHKADVDGHVRPLPLGECRSMLTARTDAGHGFRLRRGGEGPVRRPIG